MELLDPVLVDPVLLDPVLLDPVLLDPVLLDPVLLDPVLPTRRVCCKALLASAFFLKISRPRGEDKSVFRP